MKASGRNLFLTFKLNNMQVGQGNEQNDNQNQGSHGHSERHNFQKTGFGILNEIQKVLDSKNENMVNRLAEMIVDGKTGSIKHLRNNVHSIEGASPESVKKFTELLDTKLNDLKQIRNVVALANAEEFMIDESNEGTSTEHQSTNQKESDGRHEPPEGGYKRTSQRSRKSEKSANTQS
jgi:hypothetical protein